MQKNYFELLDVPVQFTIDLNQLAENYRTVQKEVHPDRFSDGTEQEQRVAVQYSSLINEAYRVLKVPLTRAGYLLEIKGVELEQGSHTINDPAFLMEQMELREELEALQSSKDTDAEDKLFDFVDDLDKKIKTITKNFADILDNVKYDKLTDEGQIEQAINLYRKMQFFNKLQLQIDI